MWAAGEKSKQALSCRRGPATPYPCQIDNQQCEKHPETHTGPCTGESHNRYFTGRDGKTCELHIIEGLKDGRDQDDPANPDKAIPCGRHGAKKPFPTSDRYTQRDHAGAENKCQCFFEANLFDLKHGFGCWKIVKRHCRAVRTDLDGCRRAICGVQYMHFPLWMEYRWSQYTV